METTMLGLIGSYPETSEWLLLIAAVVFVIAAVLKFTVQATADGGRNVVDPTRGALVPIGLALVAVAWLIV
jgi:hypothetical protein